METRTGTSTILDRMVELERKVSNLEEINTRLTALEFLVGVPQKASNEIWEKVIQS